MISLSSPVCSHIGSLSALLRVLANQTGYYPRVLWYFKLPRRRNGLFLWWKQVFLGRKKNQSCLYCLLAISGCWSLLILLKAPTITTNPPLQISVPSGILCYLWLYWQEGSMEGNGLEFPLLIYAFFFLLCSLKQNVSLCASAPRSSSATTDLYLGVFCEVYNRLNSHLLISCWFQFTAV